MTRGPPPKKGLDEAMSAATPRGTVMRFTRQSDNPCNFMIRGNGSLILVAVMKARRLGCSLEEVEREFRDTISGLRTFPASAQIILELWTYSRRGIMRFFCIEQTGIVEIGQDGTPLKNPFIVVSRSIREVHRRKKGSAIVNGKG